MTHKKAMHIFGTRIDLMSHDVLASAVDDYLTSTTYHRITTLNPEILLAARESAQYREVVNHADINIIDGTGVCLALWQRSAEHLTRVTGVDLMHMILTRVDACAGTVFLATRRDGLSTWTEAKNALEVRYPHIVFSGADLNPQSTEPMHITADVILCNFGAPGQEVFLQRVTGGKIGVGVGGAFDFATGALLRAPRWMRRIGCEWAYRLYQQPHRWKRMYRALIVFPVLALFERCKK